MLQDYSLAGYFQSFSGHLSAFEVFSTWLVYPVAAFSIFAMKRWSYGAYLGCMAVIGYCNYIAWREFPQNIQPLALYRHDRLGRGCDCLLSLARRPGHLF